MIDYFTDQTQLQKLANVYKLYIITTDSNINNLSHITTHLCTDADSTLQHVNLHYLLPLYEKICAPTGSNSSSANYFNIKVIFCRLKHLTMWLNAESCEALRTGMLNHRQTCYNVRPTTSNHTQSLASLTQSLDITQVQHRTKLRTTVNISTGNLAITSTRSDV